MVLHFGVVHPHAVSKFAVARGVGQHLVPHVADLSCSCQHFIVHAARVLVRSGLDPLQSGDPEGHLGMQHGQRVVGLLQVRVQCSGDLLVDLFR